MVLQWDKDYDIEIDPVKREMIRKKVLWSLEYLP